MIIGFRRQGRVRMTPAVRTQDRGGRSRHHRADAGGRGLLRPDLPHAGGRPASPAQARAFAIFREALEAGIATVKPGATAANVARAENDVFRRYGLGDYVTNKYTGCAATASGCSAIPSRTFSRMSTPSSFPAWR